MCLIMISSHLFGLWQLECLGNVLFHFGFIEYVFFHPPTSPGDDGQGSEILYVCLELFTEQP